MSLASLRCRTALRRHTALGRLRCIASAAHDARIVALQHELASNLQPPADSNDWPDGLLRRWFDDGGTTTVRALAETPWCEATRRLVADLGSDWPVAEMEHMPLAGTHRTVLEAVQSDDDYALTAIAERLATDDAVALRLGIEAGTIDGLLSESERAWNAMRPGELRAEDGTIISGQSPSGAKRGDRFVFASSLLAPKAGGARLWPALADRR